MAATPLTVTNKPKQFAKTGAVITWQAADNVNGNSFKDTGKETVLARNPTGSPINITITSSADTLGRTGDFVHAVPANSDITTQEFPQEGWADNTGNVIITSASASLQLAVLREVE